MANKFGGRDITTDDELKAATRLAAPIPPSEVLTEMIYRPTLDVLEFRMKDGQRYFFPREKFQELQHASRRDLSEHEIRRSGWLTLAVQTCRRLHPQNARRPEQTAQKAED